MRMRKKIVCGVLLVGLGVGALTAWQWNNISAALSFVRFSQEELEEKLADNDQIIKDAVEANPSVTIREVTEEERNALRDGTLTQEELMQNLLQKPESEPKPEPEQPSKPQTAPQTKPEQKPEPKPEQKPEPEQKPPEESTTAQQPQQEPDVSAQPEQSESEQKINALLAEVFVLREQFLIKLDDLMAQAKADYWARSPEERTGSKLMGMVSSYMSKGLAMEKECDARIKVIAEELDQIVREHGGDTNLAQTVYDTYIEEKSLKKAWYMAELKKIGLG